MIVSINARHLVATIMSNDLEILDSHIKMVLNHKGNLGITGKGLVCGNEPECDYGGWKVLPFYASVCYEAG